MRMLVALLVVSLWSSFLAGQEAKTSRLVLPAIGSAPETGFQYGLVFMRVRRPAEDRPTIDQAYVLLTTKHQYQFTLEHDAWTAGDIWRKYVKLDLLDFPRPFYGVGADAPDSAEEWFTARTVQVTAKLQYRLSGPWYGLLVARALDTSIRDAEPGRAVASGTPRGSAGGAIVQAGAGVTYDSRDDIIGAEEGRYLEAYFSVADRAIGSDFTTNRAMIDGRAFARRGRGVLAGQVYVELNSGAPPFDQLSLAGSAAVLRGYERGRYRDRALAAVQLEWRAPIAGRWSYSLFGGVGGIGDTLGKVGAIALPTVGGGLRVRPFRAERTSLRLDYAKGRGGSSGLYIAINEAF